jgi:hypothetical protein
MRFLAPVSAQTGAWRTRPATSNQQPATSNQQPATSNQQPATRHISHNRAITWMLDPLLVVNSGLVVD